MHRPGIVVPLAAALILAGVFIAFDRFGEPEKQQEEIVQSSATSTQMILPPAPSETATSTPPPPPTKPSAPPPPPPPPPPPVMSVAIVGAYSSLVPAGCEGFAPTSIFYRDPEKSAVKEVAVLESQGRAADAELLKHIACQPQPLWFFGPDVENTAKAIKKVMDTAGAAQKLPVLVLYNSPDHTTAKFWTGIVSDEEYRRWAGAIAEVIGSREAWIILEPDSLSLSFSYSDTDRVNRWALLNSVVTLFSEKAPNAKVFLDAGHGNWRTAEQMAEALNASGIAKAAGFAVNIANFRFSDDEIGYGSDISARVGNKQFILDTSRNGVGPSPTGEWCNPSGRAIGAKPTLQTSDNRVLAYLWVKSPGESDGTCNGGPTPGKFWLDYALNLVRASSYAQ